MGRCCGRVIWCRVSKLQILPVLFLCFNQSPDSQQSHLDAPAPLLGMRDARLLVPNTQHREPVEARCYPQASHLGAHRCVQEEIDTGTFFFFTRIFPLSHRLTQNRLLWLPLVDRIVPATSLEDTQGSFKSKFYNDSRLVIITIRKQKIIDSSRPA